MEEIFSNAFVTVSYDKKGKIIRAKFSGIVDLTLAKNMFEALKEYRDDHEIRGSIADIKEVMGGFAKMTEYLKHYFEDISKKGNRCTAVVVSEKDILTMRSTEKLMELPLATELQMFSNADEAEIWVRDKVKEA